MYNRFDALETSVKKDMSSLEDSVKKDVLSMEKQVGAVDNNFEAQVSRVFVKTFATCWTIGCRFRLR
jgi:hypothetical protein